MLEYSTRNQLTINIEKCILFFYTYPKTLIEEFYSSTICALLIGKGDYNFVLVFQCFLIAAKQLQGQFGDINKN